MIWVKGHTTLTPYQLLAPGSPSCKLQGGFLHFRRVQNPRFPEETTYEKRRDPHEAALRYAAMKAFNSANCRKSLSTSNEKLQTQQRWFLLRLKAVNNVLGHKGVLVDLERQTEQSSKEEERLNSVGGLMLLTAFTSNANNTCCRSGDTWYFVALHLF